MEKLVPQFGCLQLLINDNNTYTLKNIKNGQEIALPSSRYSVSWERHDNQTHKLYIDDKSNNTSVLNSWKKGGLKNTNNVLPLNADIQITEKNGMVTVDISPDRKSEINSATRKIDDLNQFWTKVFSSTTDANQTKAELSSVKSSYSALESLANTLRSKLSKTNE